MPILSELRRKFTGIESHDIDLGDADETFVSDVRNGMRSTQIIDRKVGIALARDEELTENRDEHFRRHPKG